MAPRMSQRVTVPGAPRQVAAPEAIPAATPRLPMLPQMTPAATLRRLMLPQMTPGPVMRQPPPGATMICLAVAPAKNKHLPGPVHRYGRRAWRRCSRC